MRKEGKTKLFQLTVSSGLLRPGWIGFATLLVVGWIPSSTGAQETPSKYFEKNCAGCHTIGGGRLTGPDLKNVTKLKDRDWALQFMLNPDVMIKSDHKYAEQLRQDFPGVFMPPIAGMTTERADAMLELIEAESMLEKSQFARTKVPERELTSADVARGREIFMGYRALEKGGPACISCHTVEGLGPLGGGRLGPDLTKVFEKMRDRKQFAAWLSAPATPTMLPIYKDHPLQGEEILALIAYFDEAKKGRGADSVASLNFFLLGLGGTCAGLVLFDVLWRRRFRHVRRDLVHSNGKLVHG
jgi:mono/diheme cytochrome c family protein